MGRFLNRILCTCLKVLFYSNKDNGIDDQNADFIKELTARLKEITH